MIEEIQNRESGLSVRNKLNELINTASIKPTTPTPTDQLSSLRIDENGQYQTSNNFYVKNNIELNQVLQLEDIDIINIFLTENLSFEFDSMLDISARRINIYNDVKININYDITFNFLNSENTSVRVFSQITTFGNRTITILGLYNNIFNNFYFNGVNCDTALSNGQLTFVANDYIAPYKSVININSLHNIDLVYSTTNITLNILDWDRNTTDKIKILRKVSESLYYSNNTRMIAVLETGKIYQYISAGSSYTIDNINVLATKDGGNTRFVALERIEQNAEILFKWDKTYEDGLYRSIGQITVTGLLDIRIKYKSLATYAEHTFDLIPSEVTDGFVWIENISDLITVLNSGRIHISWEIAPFNSLVDNYIYSGMYGLTAGSGHIWRDSRPDGTYYRSGDGAMPQISTQRQTISFLHQDSSTVADNERELHIQGRIFKATI